MELCDRLEKRSTLNPATGCIEWQGGRMPSGYGSISVNNKTRLVHRVACELAHGPAPDDKPMVCHRCDNVICINPTHLYWGDAFDNARDKIARGRTGKWSVLPTHCSNGHPWTEENTSVRSGGRWRSCRACNREKARRYRERKRG